MQESSRTLYFPAATMNQRKVPLKVKAPFGLELTQTQSSVLSSHNSNSKLMTQFSNSVSLKNCKTHVWVEFSVTYLYHFSPNPWTPPLTLPTVASIATRVSPSLSLYLLPPLNPQPLTRAINHYQSTTTNPATSHHQPLQTDPPPQT